MNETNATAQTSPEVNANQTAAAEGTETDQKAIAAEVKAEIRRMKLKVDGKEEECPEDEVIRRAQRVSASDKRFEEAAHIKKQAMELINRLKTDPRSILSDPALGVDVKKFAKQIVWEEIQDQMLTPEQKHIRDLEEREAQRQDDAAKAKAKADEDGMAALHQKYASEYDKTITAALQTSGLPKTPATVRRMTDYLFHSVKHGYDLDPADLVAQVRRDYGAEHKEMYGSLTAEQLIELLGEDVIKKIRDADLRRLKSTTGEVFKKSGSNGSSPPKKLPKGLKGADWRAAVMKEALGK